jgi:hypothetical protein
MDTENSKVLTKMSHSDKHSSLLPRVVQILKGLRCHTETNNLAYYLELHRYKKAFI